ncbi:SPOR domain-containing protein [Paracidobacterium acidisoli]|uniref:SPOR domain-containing protein n=1 Tax=Paracidobacterium acidisoli TaxID=2303751 RepID=A0A372IJW1_9BACT|nr:SPOR domain-containing protein [Paracidobacterium acidisoli]MBT9333051.1 SPOR domain-containing protein [Paracidobacterium acidisoli]
MKSTLDREEQQTDTEITLGMTSLLGIFFGLVLICGIFFGLGYSLGRGNGSHAQSAATPSTDATTASANHAPKPSADQGSSLPQTSADSSASPSAGDSSSVTVPTGSDAAAQTTSAATPSEPAPTPAAETASTPPAVLTRTTAPAQTQAMPRPAVASTAVPSSAGPSSPIMVQIAAVSHQEDADVLISALRRRGYSATAHSEPQDKLLHVQIGPFASRDEARAMRTRLLADGYNAIVK